MLGSAGVTAAGLLGEIDAGVKMAAGALATPETGGAAALAIPAGAAEAVASTAAVKGGASNLSAVSDAMSGKRAGDFKSSTREGAIKANAEANGGQNKCEKCGGDVQRVGNQKGQAPPGDQLQVHHDPAIKDGGGANSKPVVVCRDCHVEIHKQQ